MPSSGACNATFTATIPSRLPSVPCSESEAKIPCLRHRELFDQRSPLYQCPDQLIIIIYGSKPTGTACGLLQLVREERNLREIRSVSEAPPRLISTRSFFFFLSIPVNMRLKVRTTWSLFGTPASSALQAISVWIIRHSTKQSPSDPRLTTRKRTNPTPVTSAAP